MGGGGGPSSVPSTTTQIQKVELPKWVEKASEDNYEFAKRIADKPYRAYDGKTLAGESQDTLSAYDLFRNTLNTGTSEFNQANDLFRQAGQGMTGMDRSAYMNPYVEQVVDKSLGALDKSRVMALMGNADAAQKAKAFGGDRAAVIDAVTNAETAEKAGMLASGLYKDAYDSSSNLMQRDIANKLSSGQGLLAGGQSLSDKRLQDFTGLLSSGQAQTAAEQAKLDDARAKWEDEDNYDLERLNVLMSALGMSPYGKTENTKTEGQQFYQKGDNSGAIIGGVGMIASIAAMMF